jgi:hypothetical protein
MEKICIAVFVDVYMFYNLLNRLIGLGNLGFGKLGIGNLGCYRSDTIRPCQNIHRNAPGGQILLIFKFPEYL